MIKVYVDGSYNRLSGRTGSGVVIILPDGDIIKRSKLVETQPGHSWNIDGECHAVLEALSIVYGHSSVEGHLYNFKDITIYYDYEGIEKWANRTWQAKSDIAKLYIREIDRLMKNSAHLEPSIKFKKVKAHSGDLYNDMVDGLAKAVTDVGSTITVTTEVVRTSPDEEVGKELTPKQALENIRVELFESFGFFFNLTQEYRVLKEFIDGKSNSDNTLRRNKKEV